MLKQLTETEFSNTFGSKMTDVTKTARPVVDIWNYVKELTEQKLLDKYVYEKTLVEVVYRNDTATFDHVLLPTAENNVFITLVIDLVHKKVHGHIRLDLNKKYGLKQ